MKRLFPIGIIALSLACKPKASDSDIKTLDNFAAGKRVAENDCVGNPALADDDGLKVALSALEKRIQWETKKPKEKMLAAINRGFSAIPPDFQATFLELGGSIIVSSESNGLCTMRERLATVADPEKFSLAEIKAMKEGFDEVSACYIFMPPSAFEKKYKSKGQMISIILPDDPTEIQHSFVRSFGYLVSQLYSRLVFVKGSEKVTWISMENAKFRKKKNAIASAFLKDIRNSDNKDNFKEYFSGKASAEDLRNLADFVYAEAFDSYFCNAYATDGKNTRERMRIQFNNTFNAFIGISSEKSLSLKGSDGDELGKVATNTVYTDTSSAKHALVVGKSRNFDNSGKLIGETMNRYNWYMLADTPGSKKSSSGLGLWWNPLTAVKETFQGAGILYGEYYERTQQATQRAFDRAYSGGQSPGVLGTVSAVATGVSDGTGYTDVYNNIQQKTDRIYTQVQEGRGTDKPLGLLDTTSVVLNATADQVRNVPGPVGTFMGAAQDGVTTFDGGKFDENGNFREATTGERLNAAVGLTTTVLGESGATEALTNSVLGSGGMIKRWGQQNTNELSGLGQADAPAAGQGLQQLNIVNRQLDKAFEAQNTLGQAFQAVNGLNEFAGGPSIGSSADRVETAIMTTTGMVANSLDAAPKPQAPVPAPTSSVQGMGP